MRSLCWRRSSWSKTHLPGPSSVCQANYPADTGGWAGHTDSRSVSVMDMVRQVIVFDAADLHAESTFWAGILGGHVFEDDNWHSVIDAAGQWRIGVQLAPDHVP